jgi:excisionase family DNA binding protein
MRLDATTLQMIDCPQIRWVSYMPKVNFKSYLKNTQNMPTELQLIVSCYGPFLSLKEAAECLHRSYETIYALVRSDALRACRTGKNGQYIVSANDIAKFFEKNSTH